MAVLWSFRTSNLLGGHAKELQCFLVVFLCLITINCVSKLLQFPDFWNYTKITLHFFSSQYILNWGNWPLPCPFCTLCYHSCCQFQFLRPRLVDNSACSLAPSFFLTTFGISHNSWNSKKLPLDTSRLCSYFVAINTYCILIQIVHCDSKIKEIDFCNVCIRIVDGSRIW